MYGLKQSGRAWYKCLSAAINKIGFTKSKYDAVVFYRHNGTGFAIIAIAVDNLTMTATNDNIIYATTSQLYCTKRSTCPQAEKAMYGLKQSGQAWYKCLSAAMKKIGYTKSKSDTAVFYRHNGKGFAIIAVAVDDLTMTATNDNIICEIKADLMKIFKLKDLGELHWLLNLKIK